MFLIWSYVDRLNTYMIINNSTTYDYVTLDLVDTVLEY